MSAFSDRPEPRRVPPGTYPLWDAALVLLNRDLAATLPGQEPLHLLAVPAYEAGEAENVYIALGDGEWHGNSLYLESAQDPAHALAIIADAAQETVAERLWQAWPLCEVHDLGMHPRDTDGLLSWWCAGPRLGRGPAHPRAAVGALHGTARE